jgi:protocatechuate 3,4-dioxygenase beta subunit
MSRPYRLFGIFLLVVASLLVAATPAAAASATGKSFTLPAVTKTTYSISGTVRANSTSALESNVSVYASSTTSFGSFTSGSATTAASGTYTISHLLPGSYNLRFDPPRATNLQHGYRNATAPTYFSVSTPVAVTITTASRTGMNIRLPGGFKISGKVTRSNGTTVIPNLDVSAGGTNGNDNTTTDSAGNYTLMGLSPGSYGVSFGQDSAADNQTGCWYTTPASKFSASCASHTNVVISSANVAGISPKIPNALKITGYVKTRASVPIVGAWVNAAGPEDQSAYTDATGKYTIIGLNPGSYKIEVDGPSGSRAPNGYYYATGPYYWATMTASASSVVISAAVTTLPIIKPPTGYYIKGKITNTSGTALDFVFVQASGGAGTAAENPSAFTDASGNYTIGPVPAGNTYKIYANPLYSTDPSLQQGWYLKSPPNNFTTASSSAFSILVNADIIGINMRLPKGASISGIVKITGGSACNYCVVDALNLTGSVVASTNTSSSGAYTLQGLSAGSYHVNAYTKSAVIDATHVRIITNGYYKSGAAPNFSATLAGATAIAVS